MDQLRAILTLLLLSKSVSSTSRLQTFCSQQSGQWFNMSQTCVVMYSEKLSTWNDGWDYCSSFIDNTDGTDTITGRLPLLEFESERATLASMLPWDIYLGIGSFVASNTGNASDWNWCDTKACGRDGGQPKHPISINMSTAVLAGPANEICGMMKKSDKKIYSIKCDGAPAEKITCQYFLAQTRYIGSNKPPAHYVIQSSSPNRSVLRQYLNVTKSRQCAHDCYVFIGCKGYQLSTNGTCTLLGAFDTSPPPTIANAFIDQLQ